MPMTFLATRNVPERFRGFIASLMVEVAPGVYIAPRMSQAVRERMWNVLLSWSSLLNAESGIVIVWRKTNQVEGLDMATIGWPKKELLPIDGQWLSRSPLRPSQIASIVSEEE